MLREALINSLNQISDILEATAALPEDQAVAFYCDSNAGKHVRHVLDHLLAFIPSVEEGVLDYNRRNRESVVETDWNAAQRQIESIIDVVRVLPISEQPLKVISEVDACATATETFASNVPREILYLVNHTIHHAAYVKLLAKGCGISLADNIGIAPATATHLRKAG